MALGRLRSGGAGPCAGFASYVVFVLSLLTVAGAQNKPAPDNPEKSPAPANESYSRLPVKRVVLYKNGVGYFEHTARVRQLNDVLKHPLRDGWKLAEGPKAEETTASFYRFRVRVEPGSTSELPVEEYHPLDTSYQLTNLDENQVVLLTQQGRITPAMQEVFRRVLDQKNQFGIVAKQIQSRQQEVESINKDQARLRENMKALKGSAEEKALLQRYTRQLDSQEDRLNTLTKEIADLQQKYVQVQAQLDRMVQEVALDEHF
jgi:hypothetical protein